MTKVFAPQSPMNLHCNILQLLDQLWLLSLLYEPGSDGGLPQVTVLVPLQLVLVLSDIFPINLKVETLYLHTNCNQLQ